MSEQPKRTWVYVMPPSHFEIAGCGCGNNETQWSEYKDHLWCETCQEDFTPEHWGILDGPVGIKACLLLGINFDRMNLETKQIERVFEKERSELGLSPIEYEQRAKEDRQQ